MSIEGKGLRAFVMATGMACVLTTGLASPAEAAVNLLLAPSFEAGTNGTPDASGGDVPTGGTTPWSGWNNWVPPYSGFYTAAVARTGTQAAKTFSGANAGIFQAVNVVAGDTYTASAYFMNSSIDPLGGGAAQTVDVRLTFQDAGGNAIGDAVVSPTFSGAGAQNVWTELSVTAVAPAGASRVQFLGFLNNPNNAGGSLFMDDASLINASDVPEPASLAIVGTAAGALLARRRKARLA